MSAPVATRASLGAAEGEASTQVQTFAANAERWKAELNPYLLASGMATPRSTGTAAGSAVEGESGGASTSDQLSTGSRSAPHLRRPVLRIPQIPAPERRFEILQQFEGTVLNVGDDEFVAELRDLTKQEKPPEEATFDLSEVSDGDRPLLAVGAVFYWTLGYAVTLHGQKSRVSELRFRRWPPWTRRELKEIDKEADELYEFFGAAEPATRTG